MEELSLIDLYETLETKQLYEECKKIIENKRSIPLKEILDILNDTDDIDMSAMLVQTLISRLDEVDDYLMEDYYYTSNDIIKEYIIMAFSLKLKSKYMQFLLDEYYKNPYMRPTIRSKAFKDKRYLFMNLARYYENIAFNEENVTVTQQLLKTIPRKEILTMAPVFSGSEIMTIYYAMPIEDQE